MREVEGRTFDLSFQSTADIAVAICCLRLGDAFRVAVGPDCVQHRVIGKPLGSAALDGVSSPLARIHTAVRPEQNSDPLETIIAPKATIYFAVRLTHDAEA